MSVVVPIRDVEPDEESPFGLTDYVQLACMGNRCARIVLSQSGRAVGTVVVWNGELWSARDGRGAGEKALGRLMFMEGCSVRVGAMHDDELDERDVHAPWQHVLLEAARLHDEAALGGAPTMTSGLHRMARPRRDSAWPKSVLPPPPLPTESVKLQIPRPAPAPPEASWAPGRFDDHFEEGVEALLDRRFEDALAAFERAADIRPDDPKVRANLQRLHEMGYGTGPR